jgi:hypothetical protein
MPSRPRVTIPNGVGAGSRADLRATPGAADLSTIRIDFAADAQMDVTQIN